MSSNDEAVIGRKSGTPDGSPKEERQVGTSPLPRGSSIDDLMVRVRAEVARRRNGSGNGVPEPAIPVETRTLDQSMPRWKPSVPRLPIKNKYQLSEFLAFSDADFVEVAHLAILRRPPDKIAFNYYLHVVRGGGAAKILILKEFLSIAEGQSNGVQIEGLDLPTRLEDWRGKRFIGPIVKWVHALLRLGTFSDRQATFDAIQAREIHELGHLVNEASEYFLQRLVTLETEMKRNNATVTAQLMNFETEVHTRFQTHEEHVERLESRLKSAASSLRQLQQGNGKPDVAAGALDQFYAAFEDRFRGDRSVVRARVEPYLSLMREVGAGTREAPIVDIGCGRGEWLELLRDSGLIGLGVEINRIFIDFCRGLGLEIVEEDAVESLRAMKDGSAGAITAMHVVEHLPFEIAIALLDEARRVLRPGGLIILETPNPENLSVGHHWFYMDPTHRNPLPPESLRWIVEERGFHDVRIERLFVARETNVPSPLPMDVPGAAAVNVLLESMSAAQDYAIVGKRP